MINWSSYKASKCERKKSSTRFVNILWRCNTDLNSINQFFQKIGKTTAEDKGQNDKLDQVAWSLTLVDMLSKVHRCTFSSHDKWWFPYLRLQSALGPNSAINPYEFWPKTSSAHLQLFPMINSPGFRQNMHFHIQVLHIWVSLVKRGLSVVF